MKASKGIVTEIQRWSLDDGEGIRTTVFLKGCPLRCAWCHNPETHKTGLELAYRRAACLLCGKCVVICSRKALSFSPKGIVIDRNQCNACGSCVANCPGGAMSITGRVMSTAEVMDIIERDAVFYRSSGGGATFSGGEPTAQKEFLEALAEGCESLGIGTAIETAMYFEWEEIEPILKKMDMIFADLKFMDSNRHKEWTGVGNEIILENLRKASALGKRIVIRIPLMKDVNDTEENMRSTAEFINNHLSVERVELLPYHKFGKDKYASLNKPFLDDLQRPSDERISQIIEIFENIGVSIVSRP